MTIYIIILLFVWIIGILLYYRKVSSKHFLILVFPVLALVLGLRGTNVGEDTAHYIAVFNNIDIISWGTIFSSGTDIIYETVWNIDRSMEVGYVILNKLISIFTSNSQWLLMVVACITCYLIAKFIFDNCTDVFFATYIFLCESLYMQSFNLMRQMLALAIGLQAYTVLRKENRHSYIYAAIIIFIAFLFHKSAIALLIIIPLWMCKNSRKALKYTLIGSMLVPFFMPILSDLILLIVPRYAGYIINNYWNTNVGGVIFLWMLEVCMILFVFFKYKNDDGKEVFISTTCTAIYIVFEIISLKLAVFSRITLYYRAFLIFMFPYFANYLKPKSRFLYKTLVIILLSAFYLSYASVPTRTYVFSN